MEVYNLLVGSFNPLEMDLSKLQRVRLAGYLIADGGEPADQAAKVPSMRIQRVFLREDGKIMLHTISWTSGVIEFRYSLDVILKENLTDGTLGNIFLPAMPLEEIEQKAQEIEARLKKRHRR